MSAVFPSTITRLEYNLQFNLEVLTETYLNWLSPPRS